MEINVTISFGTAATELIGNLVTALQSSGTTVVKTASAEVKPPRRARGKGAKSAKTNGAAPPAAGDVGDQNAAATEEFTIKQVRNTMRVFVTVNGQEKGREILDAFDVESITALFAGPSDPEKVAGIMEAITQ